MLPPYSFICTLDSKQSTKQADFTVDLIWCRLRRLATRIRPYRLVGIDHFSIQKLHELGGWASKKLMLEQVDFMKSAKFLQWTFMLDDLFLRLTNFKDFSDVHRSSIISILKIVLSNIVTAYHLLILKNLLTVQNNFWQSSKFYILENKLPYMVYIMVSSDLEYIAATNKIPTLKWYTVNVRYPWKHWYINMIMK